MPPAINAEAALALLLLLAFGWALRLKVDNSDLRHRNAALELALGNESAKHRETKACLDAAHEVIAQGIESEA
jgi:hypothetical protein